MHNIHPALWSNDRTDQGSLPKRRHVPESPSEPSYILLALVNTAVENRDTVAGCLEKRLVEVINKGDDSEALTALELGLHFAVALYRMPQSREPKRELLKFWNTVSDRVFDCCFPRIEALICSDFNLCYEVFLREKTSIQNVIAWHGLESIVHSRNYVTFPAIRSWPIADWLITAVLWPSRLAEQGRNRHDYALRNLKTLGGILLSAKTPWWTIEGYEHPFIGFYHWLEGPQSQSKGLFRVQTPDNEILFGLLSLCAAALEACEQKKEASLADFIKKSDGNIIQLFRWTLVARFEAVDGNRIAGEFQRCRFSAQQQAFISRWVNREISLVSLSSANSAEI